MSEDPVQRAAAPAPPVLSDPPVRLRPWRTDDGPDDHATSPALDAGARPRSTEGIGVAVLVEDEVAGWVAIDPRADGGPDGGPGPDVGRLTWALREAHRGAGHAQRAVRLLVDWALTSAGQGGLGLGRVEARVGAENEAALRTATRSGLRREGLRRGVASAEDPVGAADEVVLARLATDPPLSEPGAFRALLNSFLPRKRGIAQLLVRDEDGRVLVCQLTYKRDWDLPGGVVEVGESPRDAVGREVLEELALHLVPGRLLLTDWLPPWGGWDDALCLVFDGGVHEAGLLDAVVRQRREIRSVAFLDAEEVRERCADFTARRIEAALGALDGGAAYTESGREV